MTKAQAKVQRYERELPGERVQMDICKIRTGLYQHTAVHNCTSLRVLWLYPRRTSAHTLRFIDRVNEEMPFVIQRMQTNRGRKFFAYKVQERLMAYDIKFRPIKPRSPHLNGKVERSQKTDWEEFYSTVDLDSQDLEQQLEAWQDSYN